MNISHRLRLSAIVTTAILSMQTGAIAVVPTPLSFQAISLSENAVKASPNQLKADDDDTPKGESSGRGSRRDIDATSKGNNTKKNEEPDTPGRTIGRGSRGICDAQVLPSESITSRAASFSSVPSAADLTTLSPERGIGATTASHPTFFWYLPDRVPKVIFTLLDDQLPKPVFQKEFQNPAKGVMQVALPATLPALVPGRNLRWHVTIVCNPDDPSANIVAKAWIKYTPATPDLKRQLEAVATQTSPAERLRQQATVFQTTGLWYDALQALMKARAIAPANSPTTRLIQRDLSALMTQERLQNVNAQSKPPENSSI